MKLFPRCSLFVGLVLGIASFAHGAFINFEEFPADNDNGGGASFSSTRYDYLGVTFQSSDDGGTIGGAAYSGNWGIDGTNGTTFSGFNGVSFTMKMLFSGDVTGFSLDASRALGSSSDTSFVLTGWKNGALIESVTLLFGGINHWDTVSLNNIVDEVRWQSIGPSPNRAFGVDNIQWTPVPPVPENLAPTVDAGTNQTIPLPIVVSLNGTVSDDGLPNPPGSVTTTWTKVSGPGTVTFGNASLIDTTASFSVEGVYVLQLTADDGALDNSAQVTITVNAKPVLMVPDLRGTWTEGPATGLATGCQDPGKNGSFSDPGGDTYSITNQTGGSFTFSRVDTAVDGGDTIVQTTNCSGTVVTGPVRASCTYSVTLNGGFWYSGISTLIGYVGGTFTYTLSGRDLVGDTCLWNQTSTDTRSGPIPPPIVIPINDPHDLSGDGKSDLLWQNVNSTIVAIWLMNGPTIGSFSFLGGVPAEWQIKGIGDVNSDGQADVVWQHSISHIVAIWFMNGLTISSVGFPGGVLPEWELEAVGDINGDGKGDLIWVNANTGQVAIWVMDGPVITWVPVFGPVAGDWENWHIDGVSDVDGNGTGDLIWHNMVTGQVAVWPMAGFSISPVRFPGIPSTDWEIAGFGDVDGNGTSDIVWRNTLSGAVAVWFMNGGTIGSVGFPAGVPLEWKLAQVGDANGDGKADLIWHNQANGLVAVWFMDGLTISSVGFPGKPSTDWEIKN